MRIAILSDIHGNLPALRAVMARLEELGPFDAIVGLGDYVMGGIYPAEVLAELQQQGWPLVRGNTEEWVVQAGTNGEEPAVNYPPGTEHRGALAELDQWTADHIGPDGVAALRGLPLRWDVTGPSGQLLAAVHSTPSSTHPVNRQNATDDALSEVLEEAKADVLLYAHIHYAHIRDLPDGVVACIGSVGAPYDGDARACFMVAEDTGEGWSLQHERAAYDVEAYLNDLATSDMPMREHFITTIRDARAG